MAGNDAVNVQNEKPEEEIGAADASSTMMDQVGNMQSTDPLMAKEEAAFQTATLEHEGLLPVASIDFVNEKFDDIDNDKSGDLKSDELKNYQSKDLNHQAQVALIDNVAKNYDDIRYASSGQKQDGITHEDLDLKLGETTREAQKYAATAAAGGLLLGDEQLFNALDNRNDQKTAPDGQIELGDLKAFTDDKESMSHLSEEQRKSLETLRDQWDTPAGHARRGITGEQDSLEGDGLTQESLITGLDGVPDDFAATERGAMSMIANQKLFGTLDNFSQPESAADGQVGLNDLDAYLNDSEASGKLEAAHRNSLKSVRDHWDDISGQVWRTQMTDQGLVVGDTITQDSLQTRMALAYGDGTTSATDRSQGKNNQSQRDYLRQEDGPQPN